MSMKSTQPLKCPECGHEQDIEVWGSINVTLDPSARIDLFAGSINLFNCDSCGHKSTLPFSLLYNDAQRQICVHYYPINSIKSDEFLEQFMADGSVNAAKAEEFELPDYMRNMQVVFDLNEMIRYILFREELWFIVIMRTNLKHEGHRFSV